MLQWTPHVGVWMCNSNHMSHYRRGEINFLYTPGCAWQLWEMKRKAKTDGAGGAFWVAKPTIFEGTLPITDADPKLKRRKKGEDWRLRYLSAYKLTSFMLKDSTCPSYTMIRTKICMDAEQNDLQKKYKNSISTSTNKRIDAVTAALSELQYRNKQWTLPAPVHSAFRSEVVDGFLNNYGDAFGRLSVQTILRTILDDCVG